MKNHFLLPLLLLATVLMPWQHMQAQETAADGQSTEGKDFWVTFLQADQNDVSDADDKAITLALTISAQRDCDVTISNPSCPGATKNIHVTAGIKEIALYTGRGDATARTRMNNDSLVCYAINSEIVDTCAIHVEATAPISLFASNRRSKSFDATNVLPTASLLDEYFVQTIAPSDHDNKPQGTHFAIIATEDNTVIEYCPTVKTVQISEAQSILDFTHDSTLLSPEQLELIKYQFGRDTLRSPVLKRGQVFYVWSGKLGGKQADLSGTYVRALGGKKIAVFQGAPHTNLPDKIRDRDHLFSQAMPTKYWGNTFAITSSMTRGRDIVRIMALEDGTDVYINGVKQHTFDFSTNPSRTFEFEIGKKGVNCTDKNHKGTLPDPLVADSSCFITTSCAAATHLFMVSNTYDANPVGDPAMVWVNPIEQVINKISFATYGSSNTHYFNVVTDAANVSSMKLDGNSIASDFHPVSGSNNRYYFARKNISYASHTLEGNGGFIAHVYGYGDKESYGYSAGGATKPLVQFVTINGHIFTPDSENNLCGEDTVRFACVPDYEFEKIVWSFGDGTPDSVITDIADSVVPHYYEQSGVYQAKVCIYRSSSNLCAGQSAVSCIPITVTIGRYEFAINDIDVPCPEDGKQYIGKIFYSNPGKVDLKGNNVTVEFDQTAKEAGFSDEELTILPDYFQIVIPATAQPETNYGIHLKIESDCGGTDTVMHFMLNYDKDIITQRYDNVLGLLAAPFNGKELSDFQWYRASDSTAIEGQISANLNFYDLPFVTYAGDTYYVCFTIGKGTAEEVKTCACAKAFEVAERTYSFIDAVTISTQLTSVGHTIFVNAEAEATARWIDINGTVVGAHSIPEGGCTVTVPNAAGFYILCVTTDGKDRNFKIIVNE